VDKLTWHDKERDRYENYLREHWMAEGERPVKRMQGITLAEFAKIGQPIMVQMVERLRSETSTLIRKENQC
jgi:hypothetical protein